MEKRELISFGVSLFALVLIVLGAIGLLSNLVHSGLVLALGKGESSKWIYLLWMPRAFVFEISRIILGFIMFKKHDSFVTWLMTNRLKQKKDAETTNAP